MTLKKPFYEIVFTFFSKNLSRLNNSNILPAQHEEDFHPDYSFINGCCMF